MVQYPRIIWKGSFKEWIYILLNILAIVQGTGVHRSERGLTDLCVSGERCYGELGCYPCFKKFHAQSPEKIAMIFYLYTPYYSLCKLQYGCTKCQTGCNEKLMGNHTWLRGSVAVAMARDDDYGISGKGYKEGNNVLVARWSDGTAYPGNYPQACSNARIVGRMIARLVTEFEEKKGVSLNRTNLVGFSLGPHVVGAAGAALKGRALQIVGLDPANQFFGDADSADRLDETDAQMVQVFHTHGAPLSQGGLGTMTAMGDIDIYINGGELQPGCPVTTRSDTKVESLYGAIELVGCNHLRAPAIFTSSVKRNDCTYKAYPCGSKAAWSNGECFSCGTSGCVNAGYQLDPHTTQRGKFFMATQVDEGLREGDYCGPQYRITLYPDREVKGEIKIVLKNETATILPNVFQQKSDLMRTEGRSVVIAARVTNPTSLQIAYDRYNLVVKKGVERWTLNNATVSLDNGTSYILSDPVDIIDDHEIEAHLGNATYLPILIPPPATNTEFDSRNSTSCVLITILFVFSYLLK